MSKKIKTMKSLYKFLKDYNKKILVQGHNKDNVIVLDFLPNGYPPDKRPMHMKTPIAQAVGKDHAVYLSLVPKKV